MAALSARQRDALIALAALLAVAFYLGFSWARNGSLGFPLDDAYIYQVYARNLARSGQWAFVPGVPSTGSTSILWTLLIAPAYLLGIDGPAWMFALGALALVAAGLGAARWFDDTPSNLSLVIGLAVALEWHLVWAAASGMETMGFAALLVWFWLWLRRHDPAGNQHGWRGGALLGLWGGVLMLARPEGVLAAALAGLYGLLSAGKWRAKALWCGGAALGFLALMIPFAVLNLSSSGTLWPNTFYAKQTEYAVLWQTPYLLRLWDQLSQPWIGPQLILLPAVFIVFLNNVRRRSVNWVSLLPALWMVAHATLYAARLPVVYQHGRYAIPVTPIALIIGISALWQVAQPRSRQTLIRVASLAWALTVAILLPAFLVALGAPAYSRDVAFIENEMVAVARWASVNTSPDDIIAIHDIGALGYFAPRPIVDLAGLVSPTVIPFMSDSDRLATYIVGQGAKYLIVFPGWSAAYAKLVSRPEFCKIWSADQAPGYIDPSSGAGPLTVYRVAPEAPCP